MATKTLVDIIVVISYLVGVTAIGIWVGKRQGKSREGFFLGGRRFSWMLIGFSLFATNISSTQFLGQSGAAYQNGMAVANMQLIGGLALGLSAMIIIPLYLRSQIYTLPQFLKLRYGDGAKLVLGVIYVTQSFLSSPIPLYLGGLMILSVFDIPDTYLWIICLCMGGTVAIYSLVGGLTSVVVTDLVQGVILIGGGTLVAIIGAYNVFVVGDGLRPDLVETHVELIKPADDPRWPWPILVTGVFVHVMFWSTSNSGLLQRVLGAKDTYNAQCGMLLSSFLKILAVFVIVLPGVFAADLFPGIQADKSYAHMVDNMLPIGISGLVMASVIAAIMSSSDSGVMAVSSIVANDIYPSFHKGTTEKQSLLVGRIAAGCVLGFSMIAAPFIGSLQELVFPIILKISGFMLTPVGVCFVFGRFNRRINQTGAMTTMLVGFAIGVSYLISTTIPAFKIYLPDWFLGIAFYYIIFGLSVFYTVLLFTVSYLTQPPGEKELEVLSLIKDQSESVDRPLYQKYGFWFLVYLICFALTYWVF